MDPRIRIHTKMSWIRNIGQMGTRWVHMKGVLLWLVRWAADRRDYCHALAEWLLYSSQPSTIYFSLTVHHCTLYTRAYARLTRKPLHFICPHDRSWFWDGGYRYINVLTSSVVNHSRLWWYGFFRWRELAIQCLEWRPSVFRYVNQFCFILIWPDLKSAASVSLYLVSKPALSNAANWVNIFSAHIWSPVSA